MWQSADYGRLMQPADADSAVRDLVQDFTTHFNTGNFDQCANTFLPEGQLTMSNREPAQGQKSIERMLRESAEAGYQNLRMETHRVDAAGDRAIETGRYTVSIRLPNGRMVSDRGSYLAWWRRLGAWRVAAYCFSSSIPRDWQDALEKQVRALDRKEAAPRDVSRPA